jgi:hypothetical protein
VLFAMLAGCCVAGCTSLSLERQTLAQIQSTVDLRYQMVLQCLASVADNPDTLPSFSILSDGTTRVTDSATLGATTTWTALLGFSTQSIAPSVNRSPTLNWTIDPVIDDRQLAALRCACQWALYGPECLEGQCADLLDDPQHNLAPGPHFGVAHRLARLRPGWVQVGKLAQVPIRARYKACHGHTWVWVLPEDTDGLAEFTLALHDIATLDLDQGVASTPYRIVTLWVEQKVLQLPQQPRPPKLDAPNEEWDQYKAAKEQYDRIWLAYSERKDSLAPTVSFAQQRAIKPQYLAEVQRRINAALDLHNRGKEVAITWDEWMEFTTPYHGPRIAVSSAGSLGSRAPNAAPALPGAVSGWQLQELQQGRFLERPRFQLPSEAPAPPAKDAAPAPREAPKTESQARATLLPPQ